MIKRKDFLSLDNSDKAFGFYSMQKKYDTEIKQNQCLQVKII